MALQVLQEEALDEPFRPRRERRGHRGKPEVQLSARALNFGRGALPNGEQAGLVRGDRVRGTWRVTRSCTTGLRAPADELEACPGHLLSCRQRDRRTDLDRGSAGAIKHGAVRLQGEVDCRSGLPHCVQTRDALHDEGLVRLVSAASAVRLGVPTSEDKVVAHERTMTMHGHGVVDVVLTSVSWSRTTGGAVAEVSDDELRVLHPHRVQGDIRRPDGEVAPEVDALTGTVGLGVPAREHVMLAHEVPTGRNPDCLTLEVGLQVNRGGPAGAQVITVGDAEARVLQPDGIERYVSLTHREGLTRRVGLTKTISLSVPAHQRVACLYKRATISDRDFDAHLVTFCVRWSRT